MIPRKLQPTVAGFWPNVWRQNRRAFIVAGLALGVIYLLTEHTAHVVQLLPFAFLFLCPILHLFMHGGHGRHTGHSGSTDDKIGDDANSSNAGNRQSQVSAPLHKHDDVHGL